MKQIAIIGGSHGITQSLVKLLVDRGYRVITISRTDKPLGQAQHHSLDVLTDPLPELTDLNGLVYGPGSITLKPFAKLTEADFLSDYQINVLGAVRVLQFYAPLLKASQKGSVVLFSSVAAQRGMPFHASISAAKSAVEGLTKSLAAEWAPSIRVNAIAPSIVDTPLGKTILRNEKVIENMTEKHPLKRILTADEVAATAAFLISDEASGITGQVWVQDNGLISLQ